MANINNFKAFALDPNANVTSQADWEALPALLSGFTSGKASSAQVNKAIRQSTTIAALIGQFIANSGSDALDNGDVNGLVTKYLSALTRNLGLGSAAGRDVGNSQTYNIPDMSYFTLTGKGTDNLIVKGPNGLIIQVFRRTLPNSTTIGIPQTLAVTYPTPFPVGVWGVFCTKMTYAQIVTSCESSNSTGFDAVTCLTSGTSPGSNTSQAVFLAIGY
ncbi:TPA: hypothetical protein JD334_14070 [Citrobacter freundii]|jgi:hypothetical protein|nr:hypothetical protein [Citrobacter freundii]